MDTRNASFDLENKEKSQALFPGFSWLYYQKNDGNLLPWHEIKAQNGIVWKFEERFLTENADKTNHVGPVRYGYR